jgi:ABC-type branched-subunit amino acid transport system permease subunit
MSLRSGITYGLLAGGVLIFVTLIGVPHLIPDLARPIMLLTAFIFGLVLARGLRGKPAPVVLANSLLTGTLAAALMVLFMSMINLWQAEGADIKEVFDTVTLQTTAVLSGVPKVELFANPPEDEITDDTPLRTDPMGRLIGFGALVAAAVVAGTAVHSGLRRAELGARLRQWRGEAYAGRVTATRWLVIGLPLLIFAFILLTEWDVIALGETEQVVQLIASFLMVAAGLLSARAARAGGTQVSYAVRLGVNLALDVAFIALVLARMTVDVVLPGVVIGAMTVAVHLWLARNARIFEQVAAFNIVLGTLLVSPLYLDQYQNQVLGLVGIHIIMGLGLNVVVGYAGLLDLGYAAFFAAGAYAYAFLTAPRFVGNEEVRADLSAAAVTALIVAPIVVVVGTYLWRERDRPRLKASRQNPRYPPRLSILILLTATLTTMVVLRLMDGTALGEGFQAFPAFITGMIVAMTAAGIAGVLLGVPVLRLRGDYLAIVTLGFGEIVRLLLKNLRQYTGGPQGVLLIASPQIPGVEFASPQAMLYLIVLGCLLVAVIAGRLKHSRLGRAWGALRDDEDIAQATGINMVSTKLLAFVVGAMCAGIGGVLFAARQHNIFPDDFTLYVSIDVLCLIIIGGMGSIPGVIVGAVVLIGLPEVLRGVEAFRIMAFGALLIAMMLLRPEGLMPASPRRLDLPEAASPTPVEGGS